MESEGHQRELTLECRPVCPDSRQTAGPYYKPETRLELALLFFKYIYLPVCVHVYICSTHCKHAEVRRQPVGSQFSSPSWVLGVELRPPRLKAGAFTPDLQLLVSLFSAGLVPK